MLIDAKPRVGWDLADVGSVAGVAVRMASVLARLAVGTWAAYAAEVGEVPVKVIRILRTSSGIDV